MDNIDNYFGEIPPKKNKKLKATLGISSIVLFLFTLTTIFLGVFKPSADVLTRVHDENIEYLVDNNEGKEYIVGTKNYLDIKSSDTDKLLHTIDYQKEINELVKDETVIDGSFTYFDFYSVVIDNTNNILCIDNNGNLFKYTCVDDNKPVLSNDHYLVNSPLTFKLINNEDKNVYIVQTNINNQVLINQIDVNHLALGIKNSKIIWKLVDTDNSAYSISYLSNNIQFWYLGIDGDYLYLCQKENGIIKIKKDFIDYSYRKEEEKVNVQYLENYRDNYVSFLRNELSDSKYEEKLKEKGITQEQIKVMELNELILTLNSVGGDANEIRRESETYLRENTDWFSSYSAAGSVFKIKKKYFDSARYSIVSNNSLDPVGILFSQKSHSFYLISSTKRPLFQTSTSELNSVELNTDTYLDDVMMDTGIGFEDRTFNQNGSIHLNKNANSIYVEFSASNIVCILKINDDGSLSTFKTFEAAFSIKEFHGNRDDSRFQFLQNTSETTFEQGRIAVKYVGSLSTELMASKGAFNAGFTISLILTIVTAIFVIIAAILYFKPKSRIKFNRIQKDVKQNKWTYILLIPFVFLLFLFCYYEAIGSIRLSFFNYTTANPAEEWNNFANYILIFRDAQTWTYVWNMLFFLIFDVILALVPPLIFAFFLTVMKSKKYSKLMRSLMFIPGIVPGVATVLIWRFAIFGDSGALNSIIQWFTPGVEKVKFLSDPNIARWSLILMGFPFVGSYLIFYGGLMNIPSSYYEEGELEGISIWGRFFRIDLPLVMPQVKYVLVITIINSVQNYSRTYMLRSAGTSTLSQIMYEQMYTYGNYGMAAAYAMMIFLFLSVVMIINFKMQKRSYLGDSL